MLSFLVYFLLTLVLSIIFTFTIRSVALKLEIVDKPGLFRKIHKKDTPLLGGVAIFLAFFSALFLVSDKILAGGLEPHHWLGVFIGSLILMIGGFLDDKYSLNPKKQVIFPILACTTVIIGGVGIEKITNPMGGVLYLGILQIPLTFLWLMSMSYTTKLLDGVDGLVAGVCGIGGLIIFLFTITTKYYQADIALASLIFSASCFGFLLFNWHPAKIFIGEGGSLFVGFILGVLAIISGGKIAIALLAMGVPVLDLFWTMIRRTAKGKNPFKYSDKLHLHHRLLSLGIGQRKTVLIFYSFSIVFGLSGLFLQSAGKIIALGVLLAIMASIVIGFNLIDKKRMFG